MKYTFFIVTILFLYFTFSLKYSFQLLKEISYAHNLYKAQTASLELYSLKMLKIKREIGGESARGGQKSMIFFLIDKKSILVLYILIMTNINIFILSMDKSEELLLGNLVHIPSSEMMPLLVSNQNTTTKKKKAKKRRKHKPYKNLGAYLNSLKHKKFCTTSDEEPKILLTQEDIHPDVFDQTKKILDYQAYVQNLKSLLTKKDILEYCSQLNRLATQIAGLEPKQQLEKYFMLLFNNLDAEAELINYFSIAIIQIYLNYFKKYDKKSLFKTLICDHFITFVFPLVQEEAQKRLEKALQSFFALEQNTTINEILKKENFDMHYSDSSSPKKSLPAKEYVIWQNPMRLILPQNTTCYSLLNDEEIISATSDGNLILSNINQKTHKNIIQKNKPTCTSMPYYINAEDNDNKSTKHLKILKARSISTPTYILNAFHYYFLGRKSGKIIVQNQKIQKINKLLGHKDTVSGLIPLEDAEFQYLASSSYDGTVKIWHFKKEICLQTLKSNIGKIEELAKASPELLIGLSRNKFLEIWDVHNKLSSTKIKLIEVVYSPVLSIVGYKDYCLTGLLNGTILIWDPKKGHCIEEVEVESLSPIKKLSSNNTHVIATQEIDHKKILTVFSRKD